MSIAPPPRLKRRFPALMRRAPGPDWGDMGTAVALDHALDQAPEAAPAQGQPGRPAAPASAWRLWLGRRRAD